MRKDSESIPFLLSYLPAFLRKFSGLGWPVAVFLAACGSPEPSDRPERLRVVEVAPDDPAARADPAGRAAAPGPLAAAGDRPAAEDPEGPDPRPVGLGLTVDELRRVTDEIAERAGEAGADEGPSYAVCEALTSLAIIRRCASLGPLGSAVDRASFELPDASEGRGLIQHFDGDASYAGALRAAEGFATSFGTFVVGSARARILFTGAEQLSEADRARVRAVINAL